MMLDFKLKLKIDTLLEEVAKDKRNNPNCNDFINYEKKLKSYTFKFFYHRYDTLREKWTGYFSYETKKTRYIFKLDKRYIDIYFNCIGINYNGIYSILYKDLFNEYEIERI